MSAATALIAVQGPKAVAAGRPAGRRQASPPCRSFTFADATVAGVACVAARTGYTGEDGFELACANERRRRGCGRRCSTPAPPTACWPAGLGARDTLRLESRLPLYGNDLDDTTSPLEAGLGWAVKLDKGDFIGRDALVGAEGRTACAASWSASASRTAPSPATATPSSIAPATRRRPGDRHRHQRRPRHLGRRRDRPRLRAAGAGPAPGTALTIDCRGKDVAATVVKGKFYSDPEHP